MGTGTFSHCSPHVCSSAEKEHKQAVVSPKRAALEALCDATPDNGVGVSEERLKEIEAAIEALEQDCPAEPTKRPLEDL